MALLTPFTNVSVHMKGSAKLRIVWDAVLLKNGSNNQTIVWNGETQNNFFLLDAIV